MESERLRKREWGRKKGRKRETYAFLTQVGVEKKHVVVLCGSFASMFSVD